MILLTVALLVILVVLPLVPAWWIQGSRCTTETLVSGVASFSFDPGVANFTMAIDVEWDATQSLITINIRQNGGTDLVNVSLTRLSGTTWQLSVDDGVMSDTSPSITITDGSNDVLQIQSTATDITAIFSENLVNIVTSVDYGFTGIKVSAGNILSVAGDVRLDNLLVTSP